jgi:hypothetical protein
VLAVGRPINITEVDGFSIVSTVISSRFCFKLLHLSPFLGIRRFHPTEKNRGLDCNNGLLEPACASAAGTTASVVAVWAVEHSRSTTLAFAH